MEKDDKAENLPATKAQATSLVAPPEFAALGDALAKVGAGLLPSDFTDEQREESQIAFIQVRQKDLKDPRSGELLRPAGKFRTGNVGDLVFPDRDSLLLTVLGFRPGRVMFMTVNDQKPTCKSDDLKTGSRERETFKGRPVYGECDTCFFGQWGSAENGRQKCRVNRRIFAIDWAGERPVILTFSPASLRGWKQYNQFVEDQARQFKDKDGRVPFIHHLIQVRAIPEYCAEPAGHYKIRWEKPEALLPALQQAMVKGRADALKRFREAAESQQFEASDFVGGDEQATETGDDDTPF